MDRLFFLFVLAKRFCGNRNRIFTHFYEYNRHSKVFPILGKIIKNVKIKLKREFSMDYTYKYRLKNRFGLTINVLRIYIYTPGARMLTNG